MTSRALLLENSYPDRATGRGIDHRSGSDACSCPARRGGRRCATMRAAYRVSPGLRIPVRVRAPSHRAARVREADRRHPAPGRRWPPLDVGPDGGQGTMAVPPHPSATSRSSVPLAGVRSTSTPSARVSRRASAKRWRSRVGRRYGQAAQARGSSSKAKPEVVDRERGAPRAPRRGATRKLVGVLKPSRTAMPRVERLPAAAPAMRLKRWRNSVVTRDVR